mmetsp:Transcript_1137/g.4376  ORF Transcript_1137/g.4376 Transcript_1137/m.4376 type:complete len:219 (-) Transcript_1137:12-668(-)
MSRPASKIVAQLPTPYTPTSLRSSSSCAPVHLVYAFLPDVPTRVVLAPITFAPGPFAFFVVGGVETSEPTFPPPGGDGSQSTVRAVAPRWCGRMIGIFLAPPSNSARLALAARAAGDSSDGWSDSSDPSSSAWPPPTSASYSAASAFHVSSSAFLPPSFPPPRPPAASLALSASFNGSATSAFAALSFSNAVTFLRTAAASTSSSRRVAGGAAFLLFF